MKGWTMARILMAAMPAYGLASPAMPFARALVAAGHDVDFLTGEAFRAQVNLTGSRLLPFGPPEPITGPRQLLRHGRRLFAAMNDSIRRLATGHDVVVAAGVNPAIPQLERELACPVVFLSPVFFQNDRVLRHLAELADCMPAPARRVLRTPRLRRWTAGLIGPAILGARPRDLVDLLRPQSTVLNITPASRDYQPFAEDFDERCLFAGPSPTIATPDPEFPLDRLRSHPGPVIYATLGTVFNRWTGYFRAIADAFEDSDALVVITTGRESTLAQIGPVPQNVMLRSFVPQTDVLREADLCFTHGGFGSATDTVLAGVPTVVTPMGADQFFNAYRLQELGAGRVLPRRDVTPESVRRIAGDVLAGGPAPGLTRLRRSFEDAPGPAGAARAIEALLA